ncbi:MAG: hypothetical protein HY666_00015 [Chloroflexi bacterium]|nr:hypothetical protein [Chloroflexota bacterium]
MNTGNSYDIDRTRTRIDDLIWSAKANGITVLQLELPYVEGPQLGVYQESELVKLDHLLDSAYRNGVYVILSFINAYAISLWPEEPYYHPSGIEGLVKDSRLKEAFKKRMATLITRVNTVNGRRYNEDPTLLSWMLLTELVSAPENYRGGGPKVTIDDLADWVEEMASYVKSLDTNHLVTINVHSGIKIGDDWAKILSAPSLDFIEVEDAEARFLHVTEEPVDFYLRVFELEKPVVVIISFTGGALDQVKIGKDYTWQAEKLREIFKVYYEMGVAAGFAIYSWGSDLDVAYSPDKIYTYTSSNQPIAQAFLDIDSTLGSLNIASAPLQLVKLRP